MFPPRATRLPGTTGSLQPRAAQSLASSGHPQGQQALDDHLIVEELRFGQPFPDVDESTPPGAGTADRPVDVTNGQVRLNETDVQVGLKKQKGQIICGIFPVRGHSPKRDRLTLGWALKIACCLV